MRRHKSEVRQRLFREASVDEVRIHKNGTITVRREFYYRNGRINANTIAEKIKSMFKDAIILSKNEQWKQYPGRSYYQVDFKLQEEMA